MRIIVISDSHGADAVLQKAFFQNPNADLFLHLGDGEEELNRLLRQHPELAPRVWHVRGNCDIGSISPPVLTMNLTDRHRLVAVHGNLHGVKGSLETLKSLALREGADIALFGHTHTRLETYQDGIHFLNPGSAGCPRDGKPPSYGYVDASGAGVLTNIISVNSTSVRW